MSGRASIWFCAACATLTHPLSGGRPEAALEKKKILVSYHLNNRKAWLLVVLKCGVKGYSCKIY